ncbi:MAG TPA: hypothetical protein VH813_00715 [Candidatus Limnocylindrales bacterium]|jgi:hypothetical protein
MTAQPAPMTDQQLELALRALGRELAYPSAELAPVVSARLATAPAPSRGWAGLALPSMRPLRRSLVLAVAAVLLIAALVTAAVLGVPGIRILFGPAPSFSPTPTASPSATSSLPQPPGSSLRLGIPSDLARASADAGFQPVLPSDPAIGAPDAVYLEDGRVSFVWAASDELPATAERSVGLVLTEFHARVDSGAYEKMVNAGTRIERVQVDGHDGYWLSGAEHYIFYVDEQGQHHDKSWRVVGDALIWFDGELTYRLESSLGRDASIRIAESLAPPG